MTQPPAALAMASSAGPAQTRLSLLARAMVDPARAALSVGASPAAPTMADITQSAPWPAQSATAADTLARNSAAMNKVVDALKQAGGDRLQTEQVSLYPRTNDAGDVIGYAAQDSVSAHSNVAGAGQLIDAAVGAGANTVDGPTLALSNQDALYRQALQKALDDARTKAQALGEAGSFSVGPVSSITEQSAESPPVVFKAASTAGAAAPTPIEPGTQDVTADVTVVFEIQ